MRCAAETRHSRKNGRINAASRFSRQMEGGAGGLGMLEWVDWCLSGAGGACFVQPVCSGISSFVVGSLRLGAGFSLIMSDDTTNGGVMLESFRQQYEVRSVLLQYLSFSQARSLMNVSPSQYSVRKHPQLWITNCAIFVLRFARALPQRKCGTFPSPKGY
jgi:hypothetical protein